MRTIKIGNISPEDIKLDYLREDIENNYLLPGDPVFIDQKNKSIHAPNRIYKYATQDEMCHDADVLEDRQRIYVYDIITMHHADGESYIQASANLEIGSVPVWITFRTYDLLEFFHKKEAVKSLKKYLNEQ